MIRATRSCARAAAMKIKSIETFCDRFVGFVRVTEEDGVQGWGQMSRRTTRTSRPWCMHRQVAPWSLGRETDDIGALLDTIQERELKFPGSYMCRAMGGLDTALWDLRGQAGRERAFASCSGAGRGAFVPMHRR